MIFVLVQLHVIDETIFSEQILKKQNGGIQTLKVKFVVATNSIIIINQPSYFSLMTSVYYSHWVNANY